MGEKDAQQQTSRARGRWGKYVFVALVIVVGGAVWWVQRSDPTLTGWGGDLPAALEQARSEDRRVLVFFSDDPMNREDRQTVQRVLTHGDTRAVLEHENYVRVHLKLDGDATAAEQFGIGSTPGFVLLSPAGEVIASHDGYLSVQGLCVTFLNASVVEARRALSGD